jgi:hypothetical protein
MNTKSKVKGSKVQGPKRYNDEDQARIDALLPAFWKGMKAMPVMRKATDAEISLLSWCEGAGLLYGMRLCGHYAYDRWRMVRKNLRACNGRGEIHVGHVLAMVATRTPTFSQLRRQRDGNGITHSNASSSGPLSGAAAGEAFKEMGDGRWEMGRRVACG